MRSCYRDCSQRLGNAVPRFPHPSNPIRMAELVWEPLINCGLIMNTPAVMAAVVTNCLLEIEFLIISYIIIGLLFFFHFFIPLSCTLI
jgi:hypothetical protein